MAEGVAGYRAEGYRRFQLKVGGDADTDIERIRAVAAKLQPGDHLVADANTGWMQHEAMRVVARCATSTSTSSNRALTTRSAWRCGATPTSVRARRECRQLDVLLRARADLAMDVVNLKISKLGGLTKTRQARDLCVSMGIAMTLEDSWGGDITTAAIAIWRTARRRSFFSPPPTSTATSPSAWPTARRNGRTDFMVCQRRSRARHPRRRAAIGSAGAHSLVAVTAHDYRMQTAKSGRPRGFKITFAILAVFAFCARS